MNGLLAEAELKPAATVDPAMYTSSEDKLMAAVLGATRPNRFDETVYRLIGNLIDQLRSAGLNISLSSADSLGMSKVVFHERATTPVPSVPTELLSDEWATEPPATTLVGEGSVGKTKLAEEVAKASANFWETKSSSPSPRPTIEDFRTLGRSLSVTRTLAEAQRLLTEFQAPQTPSGSPVVFIDHCG